MRDSPEVENLDNRGERQNSMNTDNDNICTVMACFGVSSEDAANRIFEALRKLPPIGETEINLIRRNPSLNIFQKWRLIREIRKWIKKEGHK